MSMNKKALTPQQLAALASGAAAQVTDAEQAALDAAAAEATAAAEAAAAAEVAAAAAAAAATPAAADASVVAFLTAQLRERDQEVFNLNAKVTSTEAQLTEATASQKALMEIAGKSLSNMRMALNLAAVDMSAATPTQMLAEHATASDAFLKSFKAEGVAAISAEVEKPKDVMDPHHTSRLKATRITSK